MWLGVTDIFAQSYNIPSGLVVVRLPVSSSRERIAYAVGFWYHTLHLPWGLELCVMQSLATFCLICI